MELVGIQFVDFKGNDGHVSGIRLHCIDSDIPKDKGTGRSVYSVFLTPEKCPNIPAIGTNIDFVYNRYGKVDHIAVL